MPSKKDDRSRFRFDGFAGFEEPGVTMVPDVFFDQLAPALTEAELRVLLYIIRRTYGFKKKDDDISLKQMVEGILKKDGTVLDRGAGVAKSAAVRAVKGLVEKLIIEATRNWSPEKGDEPTTYRLRFKDAASESSSSGPVFSKRTRGGPPSGHGGVLQENTQETVIQETVIQETGISSNGKLSKMRKSAASRFSKNKVPNRQSAASSAVEDPELTPTRPAQDGLKAVGELISQRQALTLAAIAPAEGSPPPRRRGGGAKATPQIELMIADFSSELHDAEHVAQNIGQAARLWRTSGRSEADFCSLLYEARSITKQYRVKKRAHGPAGELGARNKMPYYFSVLKDLLGLKEPREGPAFDQPAAPPG